MLKTKHIESALAHEKMHEQMLAREAAAIRSIDIGIAERINKAQAKHVAMGGCPGCGSKVFACHTAGCSTNQDDFY